jgi:surfeit locus 1 family protein
MALAFRPPLWSIAPTVLLCALFLALGSWQLGRAHHKEALQAAFDQSATGATLALGVDTPSPDPLSALGGAAAGRYDATRQILLDNQPRERVPGYRVWTPLALPAGGWLIVDRGWVAADPDRRRLPSIEVDAAPRELHGVWRPLPEPGLRLAADPCAQPAAFPRVLSYPTRAQLACILGGKVADGVLLLDPALPDGFVREWSRPNPVPPSRHYAYAAQWFAFAATLLFLFFKFSLRRLP